MLLNKTKRDAYLVSIDLDIWIRLECQLFFLGVESIDQHGIAGAEHPFNKI